jgi:hypothetical protein
MAARAAEQAAVARGAEQVAVRADQRDQLGRDRHWPRGLLRPVLEVPLVMVGA